MTKDDVAFLQLGDYVKYCIENKSDEYFLITGIQDGFTLRRIGNKELLILETADDFKDFIKINTHRD